MPSDARLGLVIGLTLVILFAVLFVRKEVATGGIPDPSRLPPSSTGIGLDMRRGQIRVSGPAPGVPGVPGVSVMPNKGGTGAASRLHTVREDETLMSVAVKYYGDPSRVSFLYQANRDRLMAPDRVPEGTVLVIPELPRALAGRVGH